MARLYLRRVIVEIIPQAGSIVRVDGLRIKFKVEKTNEGNPNKCEIIIYNLSDKTISLLQTKLTKVILYAGYQSSFPKNTPHTIASNPEVGQQNIQTDTTIEPIFKGDITKTVNKKSKKEKKDPYSTKESKEGADTLTHIELHDGDNAFRNSRFSKGYPPGTSNKVIFQDIAAQAGVPVASLDGIPDFIYANGITFQGLIRDHLFKLCDKNNLDWSFQEETLQVVPKESTTKDQPVLLNSTSGLIGIPMRTSRGCEFRALLQGGFKIGRKVTINEQKFTVGGLAKSTPANGNYKIVKVIHNGDNWAGDFFSECEAHSI